MTKNSNYDLDINSIPVISNISPTSKKILDTTKKRLDLMGSKKIDSYNSSLKEHDSRKIRKVSKEVQRIVKTAFVNYKPEGVGGADVHYLSPTFYHPDLEPTSLMLPQDPKMINAWCRHFYKQDPIVAACIDLHTELSLSKFHLVTPEYDSEITEKDKVSKIVDFFQQMCDDINLFEVLLSVSHEYWLLGNVFPFAQYNEQTKRWEKIIILNPDDIRITTIPYLSLFTIDWIPNEDMKQIVQKGFTDESTAKIYDLIPKEVREYVRRYEPIPLDTDPLLGSHVAHISFKRSHYEPLGIPLMARLFKTLIYKDRLIRAQQEIAMRNMTPKHLIWAEDASNDDLDNLRAQVELSMEDPDYSIITNFEVHWEQVDPNQRMLNLAQEYDQINNEIYIGMGLSQGVLTGEGHYTGEYINLAIINEKYSRWVELIEEYVEKYLFLPIAYFNNFYEEVTVKKMVEETDEETGEITMILKDFTEKRYLYPQVKWDRIQLTDDRDQKQLVADMYNNNKIDSKTYFELFNLDYDEVQDRLRKERESGDIYMPDIIKDISSGVASELVPLMKDVIIKKMGLDKIQKDLEEKEKQPEVSPEGDEKEPEERFKE